MDKEVVCEDVDVRVEDVENKYSGKNSCSRQNIKREDVENIYKDSGSTDGEMAARSSPFVGLPYYKIKKWLSGKRQRGRLLADSENINKMSADGTASKKRMRSESDIPVAPAFPSLQVPSFPFYHQQTTCLPYQMTYQKHQQTFYSNFQNHHRLQEQMSSHQRVPTVHTSQQTTTQQQQTTHQQHVQQQEQTITQHIHNQPLCWPPVYQAFNPFFNPHHVPQMSRVLVDYLKENPHLLAPLPPTKRRRVDVDSVVPKCEDTTFDKVKRWFSTMEPETLSEESTDCEVEAETQLGTTDCKSSDHIPKLTEPTVDRTEEDTTNIINNKRAKKCDDSDRNSPDDVSVMVSCYNETTNSVHKSPVKSEEQQKDDELYKGQKCEIKDNVKCLEKETTEDIINLP